MNPVDIVFFFVPRGPEPQIIDFVTQQYKLFPQIATYFALHYSGSWLWEMYNNVTSELASGQLERLPEVQHLNLYFLYQEIIRNSF